MAPYPARGDVADSVDLMSGYGLLPANVGMAAQLSENTFFTDLGFSSYNGMLATLHKNTSHGLQFDLNYTWSHSIDNTLAGCQLLCLQGLRLYLRCPAAAPVPWKLGLRRDPGI